MRLLAALSLIATAARASDLQRCPLAQIVIIERPGETVIRCGSAEMAKKSEMQLHNNEKEPPAHNRKSYPEHHFRQFHSIRSLFDLLFRRDGDQGMLIRNIAGSGPHK